MGRGRPKKVKPEPRITSEHAGAHPVVKKDVQAEANKSVEPPKPEKKSWRFRMTGSSRNPKIGDKIVNIKGEEAGVEVKQIDGKATYVKVYYYVTTDENVAKWCREQGYKEE